MIGYHLHLSQKKDIHGLPDIPLLNQNIPDVPALYRQRWTQKLELFIVYETNKSMKDITRPRQQRNGDQCYQSLMYVNTACCSAPF